MIGVILITHGALGREFLVSAERILGPQEHVRVISVDPGDGLETIRERLSSIINSREFPKEIVILVDIFGGTPSNASLSFAVSPGVEILSGVNLPMLIALFSGRENTPISELILKMEDLGKKGIISIKQKLQERLKNKK